MNFNCRTVPFLIWLLATAQPAMAAAPETAPEVHVDAAAVTGEERLIASQPQTAVNREQIDNLPSLRIGDVLKRMPGITTGGAIGEDKDIRLRGLDKEFTRIRVDGFMLPDAGEKREFQVDRLPSFMVEEIRLIRNLTAEYESDGLAGQIDIVSRPIPHKFKLEGRLGYGGSDAIDGDMLHGALSFGMRPLQHFGFLASTDALHDAVSREREKMFTNGKMETETEHRDKDFVSARLDLGLFYDRGEVRLKPLIHDVDEKKSKVKFNLEPGKKGKREEETEHKEQQTAGLELSHKHNFASGIILESRAGYHQTREEKEKRKPSFEETAVGSNLYVLKKTDLEEEEKKDRTLSFATKAVIPFHLGLAQEARLGASARLRERYRDKTKLEQNPAGSMSDKTGPKDNYSLDEDYYALFAQNEVWLTERFSVLPGLRLEHVRLDARDGGDFSLGSSRTDLNPSLHLLYTLRKDLTLRAAVSRAVNRPKFDELAPYEEEKGDRLVRGNPDLNPAIAWKYDIGADFARRDLLLGINFFYLDIKGVLEEVGTGVEVGGKEVYAVRNVGNGWNAGIELEQRLGFGWTGNPLLAGLVLWSNQTLLDSELKTAAGSKQPFKDKPDYIVNVGIDYTYQPWGTTLSTAWNYVAKTTENKADGTRKIKAADSSVDIAVYQKVSKNARLFLEGRNITNRSKVEQEYFMDGSSSRREESIGRTWLAGLEVKL